jgi:hypothetical protein
LICAIAIAGAVLVVRACIIVHAHSPTRDENAHLYRGLIILRHDSALIHSPSTVWNDPPLGEMLLAIPAWLNGAHLADPLDAKNPSGTVPPPEKNQYVMPDSIRYETGIWVSLLLLPAIGVIFHWTRSIYSATSAWLALAILLVEPTFAAHAPLLTLDLLGTSAIVIVCWLGYRYFQTPTTSRLIALGAATAVALLIKNTALILPPVLGIFALLYWIVFPWREGKPILWHRISSSAVIFIVSLALVVWVCTLFDVSVPDQNPHRFHNHVLESLDKLPLPGGLYLRAVMSGISHAKSGHSAILLGQMRTTGWWYYFPVVATFKIPIALWLIFALGAASILWLKPRHAEIPILICASIWTLSLMRQHIDIGFRHFLTPEVFWIMLASRSVALRRPVLLAITWTAVAVAAIDVALFTPDYLSYVNFPRRQVYLQISDSNIDWGQGNKEVRRWMDEQNDTTPIYVGYFGPPNQDLFKALGPRLTQYVMNGGNWISRDLTGASQWGNGLPPHGLLAVSPVLVTAQYDPVSRFAVLRNIAPSEMIGHSLLVYDLDQLKLPKREKTAATTQPGDSADSD